jgi:endoribonuclease LACTB2
VSGVGKHEPVVDGVLRVPLRSTTLPPFTHTNAYVLAANGVGLVVDPGGSDAAAVGTIAAALAALAVHAPKGIVLTHTHRDHVGGVAGVLARWPGTQVWAPAGELGRCEASWHAVGLRHGRRLTLGSAVLTIIGTPGHSLDHLALWWSEPRLLLAGDLVAGEGSIWVGLPDGDVAAYLDSLQRAAALAPRVIAPAHGPVRRDGDAVLAAARDHRLGREAALLDILREGPARLESLRDRIYPALPATARDLAERSLLAHLLKLMRERRVAHLGNDPGGPYALV